MLFRISYCLFLCSSGAMHIGWPPWSSFVYVLFLVVYIYIYMFLPLHSQTWMGCYVDLIRAVPINLSVHHNIKTEICCDWVAVCKLCLFPWIHLEADLTVDYDSNPELAILWGSYFHWVLVPALCCHVNTGWFSKFRASDQFAAKDLWF
jgi:hypothetical protein